ncbi:hypothetical protein [Nostoc sp.]|uniref:hypothetical protein n=1 Tax=Nostoc sp. TaxID=1180 RepID=UPI002FF5E797
MNLRILKLTGCNSYNFLEAMPGLDVAMFTMVTELCRTPAGKLRAASRREVRATPTLTRLTS